MTRIVTVCLSLLLVGSSTPLQATTGLQLDQSQTPPLLNSSYYDHVGVVVEDTASAAAAWAALLGLPTPNIFNNAGPAGNVTYHGVATDANILGAYIPCETHGTRRSGLTTSACTAPPAATSDSRVTTSGMRRV